MPKSVGVIGVIVVNCGLRYCHGAPCLSNSMVNEAPCSWSCKDVSASQHVDLAPHLLSSMTAFTSVPAATWAFFLVWSAFELGPLGLH